MTEQAVISYVNLTHKTTKKTIIMEKSKFQIWEKEHPNHPYMEVDVFKYSFLAWVHPKQGGNDYSADIAVYATDVEEAEKEVKKWLKKRSSVTNDFQLLSK